MGDNLGIGSSISGGVGLRNPSPALTGTPTAPTAALGTNTTQLATTAFVQASFNGNARRQTRVSADGSTVTLQSFGDINTTTGSTAALAPTSLAGPALGSFAAGTASVSGIAGNLNYRTGRNISVVIICGAAGKITDERWWFGVSDQTLATMGANDGPVGNYAAFRFSTNAGDTVWKAITDDGAGQTITSTGVVPIINTPQVFQIVFNDATPNVQFYIGGTLVATNTTHLPSASTNMRYVLTNLCFASTVSNGFTFEQLFIASDL